MGIDLGKSGKAWANSSTVKIKLITDREVVFWTWGNRRSRNPGSLFNLCRLRRTVRGAALAAL